MIWMPFSNIIKTGLVLVLSAVILWSCTKSNNEDRSVSLVQEYYAALNEANFDKVTSLILDSIRVTEEGFTTVISKSDYHHWLEWDSVFRPEYKILKISVDTGLVRITISKQCTRTLFLNGEPVVSREVIYIKKGKIWKTEVEAYDIFHFDEWNKKKEEMVAWVDRNHPELNGFIYDQTKIGALNYLKVIDLYSQRDEVIID